MRILYFSQYAEGNSPGTLQKLDIVALWESWMYAFLYWRKGIYNYRNGNLYKTKGQINLEYISPGKSPYI